MRLFLGGLFLGLLLGFVGGSLYVWIAVVTRFVLVREYRKPVNATDEELDALSQRMAHDLHPERN